MARARSGSTVIAVEVPRERPYTFSMGSRLNVVMGVVGGLLAGCAGQPGVDPCLQVPGNVCTVAGTGVRSFNGDGLPANQTGLYLPSEARRGPDGLLYIMDFNNMRLRRVEADGTVATIVGNGQHAPAILGAAATASPLENPIDFDFLPDGRVLLAQYHDPRLVVVDADGTLQLVAGDAAPGEQGDEGDGGPAEQAKFIEIAGLAVAGDGTIYVSDDLANRVRVIRNGIIDTYAGTGVPSFSGDGGPATEAALNAPGALAVDPAGNLYISDVGNCSVRKVTPEGVISTVAGQGLPGFAGDGGPAVAARLEQANGVAVGPDGTLYLGDSFNDRVRIVSPDGTITTLAGTGANGALGDGGPAIAAQFGYISRVQLDRDGGLLIADQTNNKIRKIIPPR
jgi:sugar lactone lactonase YvrE